MWIFGCSLVKSATRAFSDSYSAPWLAGGGGVYPIHSTRLTTPFGAAALDEPLDPPHAAASRTSAIEAATPSLFIGHLSSRSCLAVRAAPALPR